MSRNSGARTEAGQAALEYLDRLGEVSGEDRAQAFTEAWRALNARVYAIEQEARALAFAEIAPRVRALLELVESD